jgi:adenosylcobinamide-GDP ribazoletransferase
MKRFLAAMRFLTVAPVPGTWGTAEADLAHSVPFFPVVGLLLGGVAAALAWAMSLVGPTLVVSAFIVIAFEVFSGGFHLDGLSDTADGFLSARPRERILEIMKDSHIGVMGAGAIVAVLLVKFASLASLPQDHLWRAALLMPLAGRSAIVFHMVLLPYVRPAGLGSIFYRKRQYFASLEALAILFLVCWAVLGIKGLVVAGICIAVTLLLAAYSRHKIGGATGDTFGAACEVAECVLALTLSLRPFQWT